MIDKIICLGKNYPEHAAELGERQPKEPVLFLKPPSSLFTLGDDSTPVDLEIPQGDIHHELEVVFQLNPDGGATWFSAFSLGLDLTRRSLQKTLKKEGQPWEISKVFKHSAVVAPWFAADLWPKFRDLDFELFINNKERQRGKASQMLCPPEDSLRVIQRYFPILAGDLLFTGTPAGTGPLRNGDLMQLRWGSTLVGSPVRIVQK